jgi:hypothetical protein
MKTSIISPKAILSDEVLREVWRIKDELSASYNHDLERLFRDAQKRQRLSGRTSVNIQVAESRNEAELKWVSEGSGINS